MVDVTNFVYENESGPTAIVTKIQKIRREDPKKTSRGVQQCAQMRNDNPLSQSHFRRFYPFFCIFFDLDFFF